ncbi:MAG: glucose-inhibited division protein A [Calothrix sp. MO_167.B12]|nr:glucose-inhibited division protein A [Calothrix sp. MO_167.B12]
MDSSKIVAIITGAISVILAIAYLILVQLLDLRGEMKPAPISEFSTQSAIVASSWKVESEGVKE